LNLSEDEVKSLKIRKRSPTGQIQAVFVKNHSVNGEKFRKHLKLKSNKFDWGIAENGLKITTTGYGHGVGMCQYGADGLAKQGWDYRRILCHYYQGIRFG
jgi:stage II sporulation protein D